MFLGELLHHDAPVDAFDSVSHFLTYRIHMYRVVDVHLTGCREDRKREIRDLEKWDYKGTDYPKHSQKFALLNVWGGPFHNISAPPAQPERHHNSLYLCSRNREHHRLLMKNPPPAWWLREDSLRHALHHVYARGGGEGGGNGGEHGDDDVQDFAPKVLVFHDFLIYDV